MDSAVPIIRLKGVTFAYPAQDPVLRGVDFTLSQGERIGILGPNGSGKTTLFHIVMGLLTPREGTLDVLGREIRSRRDMAWARERVGYLFQDSDDQLFCPTVEEDVAFGPRNLGKTADEARAVVGETLALLGIGHLAERVTHRLSGGEKRLVALSTVLAMKPKALLLDEPVAGLDEKTAAVVADILPSLGPALAVISHDRDFLGHVCDSLWTFEHGKLVSEA
jgi:cobalt/nickel transport system ATP-binding protein